MPDALVGKTVRVTFNRAHWPVVYGRYLYEGHDEHGHWVRRPDGVQRYLRNIDVLAIDVTDDPEEQIKPEAF
ncbi:hypothetical protein ACWD2L_06075 [Streptomyces sp. NPDC002754]